MCACEYINILLKWVGGKEGGGRGQLELNRPIDSGDSSSNRLATTPTMTFPSKVRIFTVIVADDISTTGWCWVVAALCNLAVVPQLVRWFFHLAFQLFSRKECLYLNGFSLTGRPPLFLQCRGSYARYRVIASNNWCRLNVCVYNIYECVGTRVHCTKKYS